MKDDEEELNKTKSKKIRFRNKFAIINAFIALFTDLEYFLCVHRRVMFGRLGRRSFTKKFAISDFQTDAKIGVAVSSVRISDANKRKL